MEEGKPRYAFKKLDDMGTGIESILPRTPRLQGGAGHVKHLGRLPLGVPLGVQITILRPQVSTFEPCPALVAILVVSLLILDYRSHNDLLLHPAPLYASG
jgi:hypothetical protein